uniref:C-type lectin domain-containing protein n=1 Tax=Branchiostoma floridae TaxID=7739 RepID=C3ZPN0_BRAFL|eukprot:XP_002589516.1 hypothetical protein BRAFLDRAFT_88387 [Branchiostoma floridae]
MATREITPSPEQVHTKGEDLIVFKLSSQRGHEDDAKEKDVDVSKISSGCQTSVHNENTSPAPKRGKHTHQVKEEVQIRSKATNLEKPAYDHNIKRKQTGVVPHGPAPGISTDEQPAAAGPRYLHVGDHVVVCSGLEPEHTYAYREAEEVSEGYEEDHCSHDYNKSEDVYRYNVPEEVSFAYRAKERVVEMWSKWKSSRVCWLVMGCGLLIIASVLIAVILTTQLTPAWRVALSSTLQHNGTMIPESSTPVKTTYYKENHSSFNEFIVINSTPTYLPLTNSSVTADALPIIATFRSTTAPGQEVWIGLRKDGGSWKWRDGSPVTYSNWNPGEPNNYDGWIIATEACVAMYSKVFVLLFFLSK